MTWEDRGACRLARRPEAWFEMENAADDDREPNMKTVDFALATCATCPVREACLEAAGKELGIWGGQMAIDRGRVYGSAKWWARAKVVLLGEAKVE